MSVGRRVRQEIGGAWSTGLRQAIVNGIDASPSIVNGLTADHQSNAVADVCVCNLYRARRRAASQGRCRCVDDDTAPSGAEGRCKTRWLQPELVAVNFFFQGAVSCWELAGVRLQSVNGTCLLEAYGVGSEAPLHPWSFRSLCRVLR